MNYLKEELEELAEDCAQCIVICGLNQEEITKYLLGIFTEEFSHTKPKNVLSRQKLVVDPPNQ